MILLDMKMPKTCGECGISYLDHYYSDDPPLMCPLVYCPLGVDKNMQHSDCPIKGEYNPAQYEELKDIRREIKMESWELSLYNEDLVGRVVDLDDVLEIIDKHIILNYQRNDADDPIGGRYCEQKRNNETSHRNSHK